MKRVYAGLKASALKKTKNDKMFEKGTEMKSTLRTSKGLSSVCILMWTLKVEL